MTGKMTADLRNKQFENNPHAVYVHGFYSEPFMADFAGVGYSETPYKMKALLIDGIVWIPNLRQRISDLKSSERASFLEKRQMVVARIQPPIRAIEKLEIKKTVFVGLEYEDGEMIFQQHESMTDAYTDILSALEEAPIVYIWAAENDYKYGIQPNTAIDYLKKIEHKCADCGQKFTGENADELTFAPNDPYQEALLCKPCNQKVIDRFDHMEDKCNEAYG